MHQSHGCLSVIQDGHRLENLLSSVTPPNLTKQPGNFQPQTEPFLKMAESNNSSSVLNTIDVESTVFDDVETAMTGINMLLNNGFEEAFALFDKYK